MIEAGKLAYIKASDEVVFVLEVDPQVKVSTSLYGVATVRRPTMSSDGIKHFNEAYSLAELETPEERRARTYSEHIDLQQKFASLRQSEVNAQAGPGLAS